MNPKHQALPAMLDQWKNAGKLLKKGAGGATNSMER